jgi:L-lactate dehydrogenase complex protein LldG
VAAGAQRDDILAARRVIRLDGDAGCAGRAGADVPSVVAVAVVSDAREEILRRIRGALRDVPAAEMPEDISVPRSYRLADERPGSLLADEFAERLEEYRASVHRTSAEELTATIAAVLVGRGVRPLVAPADVPDAWLPDELEVWRDHELSVERLNEAQGVLTGAAVGIAQTGTIVLDGGPLQGRRALTLVPDYHLCVIRQEQIVGLVPEAIERLAPAARAGRPITFISGPSATSDIEFSRVEGVHGPRTLEVIIVSSQKSDLALDTGMRG